MAKPNYDFAKRQRELAKKQKKEAKQQRKVADKTEQPSADPSTTGTPTSSEPSSTS